MFTSVTPEAWENYFQLATNAEQVQTLLIHCDLMPPGECARSLN